MDRHKRRARAIRRALRASIPRGTGLIALSIALIHPEHRERVVTVDCLVDTGPTYSLRPREIVERLGLATLGGAVGGLERADLTEATSRAALSGAPKPTANGATHLS